MCCFSSEQLQCTTLGAGGNRRPKVALTEFVGDFGKGWQLLLLPTCRSSVGHFCVWTCSTFQQKNTTFNIPKPIENCDARRIVSSHRLSAQPLNRIRSNASLAASCGAFYQAAHPNLRPNLIVKLLYCPAHRIEPVELWCIIYRV